MRNNKRAARQCCSINRAYMSLCRDYDSITEFERATWYGALILGLTFGLMFFVGLV